MKNLRKLDALRGIASLVVLGAHVVQIFGLPGLAFGSLAARHAVLVFFLLSGYLITGSLAANVARNGTLDVAAYLRARFLRIYPPLVGAIVLTAALVALANWLGLQTPRLTLNWYAIRSALVMGNEAQQANGALWSLSIEVRLYVVALLVALALTTRWRWVFLGAALLCIERDYQLFTLYSLCAAAWAMGAAASMVRGTRLLIVLGALAIGAALIAPEDAIQAGCCVAYVWLIFVRPEGHNPPRWMVTSAGYSYSLYIIHFPVLLFAAGLSRSPWMAATAVPACILAASWHAKYFEDQARFTPTNQKEAGDLSVSPRL